MNSSRRIQNQLSQQARRLQQDAEAKAQEKSVDKVAHQSRRDNMPEDVKSNKKYADKVAHQSRRDNMPEDVKSIERYVNKTTQQNRRDNMSEVKKANERQINTTSHQHQRSKRTKEAKLEHHKSQAQEAVRSQQQRNATIEAFQYNGGNPTLEELEMFQHNTDSALLRFAEGSGAAILERDMENHVTSLRGM